MSRRLLFRLLAVLLGLSPFFVAEVTLRLLDWAGQATMRIPSWVSARSSPLRSRRYENSVRDPAGTACLFLPGIVRAAKAANEYRIFCLGGSTVQGRPFAIETSFTTWLELSLQIAEPGCKWEVVNCGGVSYASYRLVPILEEVLHYQPDLIIVYTGQNEFLEDRTYGHIKHRPAMVTRASRVPRTCAPSFCSGSSTCPNRGRNGQRAQGQADRQGRSGRHARPPTVLDRYRRDEKWRQDVIDHYRYNLRRLLLLARDAGLPVILMNPVSNLRDCAPFKTEHREGLTEDELRLFRELRNEAIGLYKHDRARAVQLLREAVAIDDQHAGIFYDLGKYYDGMGEPERARQAYLRAKELDICPLRILEPMNEAVVTLAREAGATLVDVKKLFEELSDDGIPGRDWLLDHVHPSILGHQRIAALLMGELERMAIVKPERGWTRARDEQYREYETSLGDFYYLTGQSRLKALRRWARGRAIPPPEEEPACGDGDAAAPEDR